MFSYKYVTTKTTVPEPVKQQGGYFSTRGTEITFQGTGAISGDYLWDGDEVRKVVITNGNTGTLESAFTVDAVNKETYITTRIAEPPAPEIMKVLNIVNASTVSSYLNGQEFPKNGTLYTNNAQPCAIDATGSGLMVYYEY